MNELPRMSVTGDAYISAALPDLSIFYNHTHLLNCHLIERAVPFWFSGTDPW